MSILDDIDGRAQRRHASAHMPAIVTMTAADYATLRAIAGAVLEEESLRRACLRDQHNGPANRAWNDAIRRRRALAEALADNDADALARLVKEGGG